MLCLLGKKLFLSSQTSILDNSETAYLSFDFLEKDHAKKRKSCFFLVDDSAFCFLTVYFMGYSLIFTAVMLLLSYKICIFTTILADRNFQSNNGGINRAL